MTSLYYMNAYQWFHILSPLAVIICACNILISFALQKRSSSTQLKINRAFSITGYILILPGWMLMHHSVTMRFINVNSIMPFAEIGWLLLCPGITFIALSFIWRLFLKKNKPAKIFFNFATKYTKQAFEFATPIFAFLAVFMGRCALSTAANLKTNQPKPLRNDFANGLKRPFSISAIFPNDFELDCD